MDRIASSMRHLQPMIQRFITYSICGMALFTALPSCANLQNAGAQANSTKISNGINHLLAASSGKADIGIIVQSMNTGAVVYQKNAHQLLTPASNQKIFTAYAALQKLGPEFKYKTQVLTDAGSISNGVVNGNLYVRFEGDPELDIKDLNQMISSLSQQGIHTVTGGFYVDANRFDEQGIAPGTVASDIRYCYGAPIGAAIINHNCSNLKVIPGRKPGQLAQVVPMLNIPVPVYNNVISKTSTKGCGLRLTESADSKYALTGCVKARSKPVGLSFAVRDSKLYSEEIIRSLLQQHQIKVAGMTERNPGNLPLKVLVSHESRPLKDLVYDMMKKSDNIIANALFKTLGAHHFNQPGSWENSSQAAQAVLAEHHIAVPAGAQIVDGSGLSRDNRVTASEILNILRSAYHDPMLAANFIPALPVSGINGTLKRRMADVRMAGKVRAKTGTMKGVSSLSGYVETNNHEVYAFAIVVNTRGGWMGHYRVLEDKICRFLSNV